MAAQLDKSVVFAIGLHSLNVKQKLVVLENLAGDSTLEEAARLLQVSLEQASDIRGRALNDIRIYVHPHCLGWAPDTVDWKQVGRIENAASSLGILREALGRMSPIENRVFWTCFEEQIPIVCADSRLGIDLECVVEHLNAAIEKLLAVAEEKTATFV